MATTLTSKAIWNTIQKNLFATVGYVTPKQQARTAGVVYTTFDNKLYFSTDQQSWKAKHIRKNPSVSITINLSKNIPFLPWIKIPPATISFRAEANVITLNERDKTITKQLFRGITDRKAIEHAVLIEVIPKGDFLNYGIGVSIFKMANPELAQSRVPVIDK